MLQKVKARLEKAGYAPEFIGVNIGGKEAQTLRVAHDYDGLYPTRETFATANALQRIAEKAGCVALVSSGYVATWIMEA